MNDFDNIQYSSESNYKKKIEQLQEEISHLNNDILKKFSSFNFEENDSKLDLKIFTFLRELLVSQRQEITWKNDDIKILEQKISDLVLRFFNPASTQEEKQDGNYLLISQLRADIDALLIKNDSNQKIIKDLESQVLNLNNINQELEVENANLRSELDVKINYRKINQPTEITELNVSRIAELEEENKKLEEKNRMLKAALLMTVDNETKNTTESTLSTDDDSKVIEGNIGVAKVKIKEGPTKIHTNFEEDSDKPERKRKCPNCGATSAFILELDDKDNIIYHNPRIYGKKYKCGDCRHEWR